RGLGEPAACSRRVARASRLSRRTSAVLLQRRQLLRLGFVDQRLDNLVQAAAVHHLAELVQRQVDAVIGDATLGVVVGANPLAAIAGTDQRAPLVGLLLMAAVMGGLLEPR